MIEEKNHPQIAQTSADLKEQIIITLTEKEGNAELKFDLPRQIRTNPDHPIMRTLESMLYGIENYGVKVKFVRVNGKEIQS